MFLSLSACSIFKGQETTGQYVDDATITANIKEAFVADSQISATQIHVETMQGVVMLSGFATSRTEKDRALQDAWKVKGVKSVKDSIAIQPGKS